MSTLDRWATITPGIGAVRSDHRAAVIAAARRLVRLIPARTRWITRPHVGLDAPGSSCTGGADGVVVQNAATYQESSLRGRGGLRGPVQVRFLAWTLPRRRGEPLLSSIFSADQVALHLRFCWLSISASQLCSMGDSLVRLARA